MALPPNLTADPSSARSRGAVSFPFLGDVPGIER
jgi:hypothetical protein